MRIEVQDDPRGLVHVNSCLVEAESNDEAHEKALALGRDSEEAYENSAGRHVRARFLGLRELSAIAEPLEDGAEIAFHERIGVSDLEARRMVRPKRELALFQAALPSGGPDYAPAEVMADVDDILPPRVASIHHAQVMIPPGGEAAARRFYGELLGMAEIEKPAALRARGGLWLQAGDRQLHLGVETPGVDRQQTRAHVAYEVTKLAAWRAKLEQAGVAIVDGERVAGLRRFELRDPFGNRVELVERERDF
jgi:catechol 2,3-dioxygenase-like lactoylglutathione lyase family enzyme